MAIIKIENLSKKYIIGHDKAASGMYKYHSLRDSLAHTARGIAQRLRHPLSPNTETTDIEEFYALKDINLEIEQGDKVGIIGRNGAGKSTLLKILSRITEPTSGKITMNGRVASLLEVGTGFHPELSGRENIYLNGAVLGMTRKEIKKKFDEIVDFAGVEKFLDTPVKRYSSGMYVRLAFAVAAHLDPEILLIDEVLAVGDAEFQKKCLGKMDEVSKQGRTILFVSHNMAPIENLCNKCISLNNGSVSMIGIPSRVIQYYFNTFNTNTSSTSAIVDLLTLKRPLTTYITALKRLRLLNSRNEETNKFMMGECIVLEIEYELDKIPPHPAVGINFFMMDGRKLFATCSLASLMTYKLGTKKSGIFKCTIEELPLIAGKYYIDLSMSITSDMMIDYIERAMCFELFERDIFNTGWVPHIENGLFWIRADWKLEEAIE